MSLYTRLANWKARMGCIQQRGTRRRPASHPPVTAGLRIEPLEGRLNPSGFGPEDGAYIVEPWIGTYAADVQIRSSDQKIVVAGQVNPNNDYSDLRMAIARYDSLGNPDTTFGIGGPSIPALSGVSAPILGTGNEYGKGLVLQADGKAVVSGGTWTNSAIAVARFNIDGTLDGGFGNGGWNSLNARNDIMNDASGIGLQSTGKIVLAGTSQASSAVTTDIMTTEVARFTTSGAVDSGKGAFGKVVLGKATGYTLTTFGGLANNFNDVAVQADDKLVAVGSAWTSGTNPADYRLIVARFTANGALDTTFNGTGYSLIVPPGLGVAAGSQVAIQPNGQIVVTGLCTGSDGAYDMLVARYNSNGTLDTSFGGGSGYVRLDGPAAQSTEVGVGVAIQPDGKIVVGSRTEVTGSPSNILVARFNTDGTPDQTFAAGGYKIGTALPNTGYHSFYGGRLALQANGSIVVSGSDYVDSTNTVPHPFLMRFSGTSSSPLLAAGGAATGGKTPQLTSTQLQPILLAAIDRWTAAGLDAGRLNVLRSATVTIENLGGSYLGLADEAMHGIRIDDDAAGFGWFVDSTPKDDSEFAKPGKAVRGHMDLLSVVAHELGHIVGLDHNDGKDDVMGELLATGTRRMPKTAHGQTFAAPIVETAPVPTKETAGTIRPQAPIEEPSHRTRRRAEPGHIPFANVFLGGVAVDFSDPFDQFIPTKLFRGRVR